MNPLFKPLTEDMDRRLVREHTAEHFTAATDSQQLHVYSLAGRFRKDVKLQIGFLIQIVSFSLVSSDKDHTFHSLLSSHIIVQILSRSHLLMTQLILFCASN